jgi:hypothetical protein
MLESSEQIRLLAHMRLPFLPMKYGQAIWSDEVRRINDAEIAIDVGKDHVEMDRRRLLGHDDDDDVGDLCLLEEQRHKTVDSRGTRPLAEADQQHILAQRMHVATFERMVEPSLRRSIVQNSLIAELGMRGEERLHDQLFRPPRVKSHRADHHVLIDRHRGIAREEKIRKGGEANS